ncbi:hypothetical protein D3C72_2081950 [compost metagenome]
MFSQARISWLQWGQREFGNTRLNTGPVGSAGRLNASRACSCQSRNIIFGRRWITTLRKLPISRPRRNTHKTKASAWLARKSINCII